MGRILDRYHRESLFLAAKFPGYDLSDVDKVEEILETYPDEEYDIYEYIMKQKETGGIRHLGFPARGSFDVMKRFPEACGETVELCFRLC